MKPDLQENKCCNKIKKTLILFYSILLQVWFDVQYMLQFILLHHLFYFILHETTPLWNNLSASTYNRL